jgi:hypothetical protein
MGCKESSLRPLQNNLAAVAVGYTNWVRPVTSPLGIYHPSPFPSPPPFPSITESGDASLLLDFLSTRCPACCSEPALHTYKGIKGCDGEEERVNAYPLRSRLQSILRQGGAKGGPSSL